MSDSTDQNADDPEAAENWVPLEDRAEEQSSEGLHPFGGVNSEEDLPSSAEEDWDGDDDGMYPWASGRGSTSGDAPWLGDDLPDETVEPAYNVPWYIELVGQSGVYLGVGALGLAILGVSLASFDIQPYANMALVFSIGIIFVAMFLGMLFQAYVSVGDS